MAESAKFAHHRARGGRPLGRRKKNGHAVGGIASTALQRLRALARDPQSGSELGLLVIQGLLDPSEADAGRKVAEIYSRYDRAMGTRRNANAAPLERSPRGREQDETESEAARSTVAARRYDDLQSAIALCLRGVRPALVELCVANHECPPGWFPDVLRSLRSWRTCRRAGIASSPSRSSPRCDACRP
jgi:hypothetical protein